MNVQINYQTIMQDGKPAFAVVPYDDFVKLINPEPTIPHEVVGMVVKNGYSLLRAWREYLGKSQEEVAAAMGVKQAAISQQEASGRKPRKATLGKWASALGVSIDQLKE